MRECFECGATADHNHNHHVVPKSKGGTQTVPLCEKCHGLVHDKDFMNVSALTKAGIEKARSKGITLGRPVAVGDDVQERILSLRQEGLSYRAIGEILEKEQVPTGQGGKRWWPSAVRCVAERKTCPSGGIGRHASLRN